MRLRELVAVLLLLSLPPACGPAARSDREPSPPVAGAPAAGTEDREVTPRRPNGTPSRPEPGSAAESAAFSGGSGAAVAPHVMVVSEQDHATRAGVEILRRGGNAVDAAVAVGFALAVVYPEAGNLGGGGFMVIRFPDGRVTTLDYREKAPLEATEDMYLDERGEPIEGLSWAGHLASGVPGSVKGLLTGLERYGRLDRATVMAPAIRLAREGFAMPAGLIGSLEDDRELLCPHPATRAVFFAGRPVRQRTDERGRTVTSCFPADSVAQAFGPAGQPGGGAADPGRTVSDTLPLEWRRAEPFRVPGGVNRRLGVWQPGDTLRQADLARTLELIARNGAAAFYEGPIADLIVAEMERGGGLISRRDLASYEVVEREPVHTTYRGYEVWSMPPASSGGVILAEILNVLERFDVRALGFHSASGVHVLAEAMRRAYADRNEFLGDPAFVEMPIATLTTKPYAAELAASIDTTRATPSAEIRAGALFASAESPQTTHYSIVDAAGAAVAVTTTLNGGFGSGVVVEGAGFFLNNEMDDFTIKPGVPNAYGLVQGRANAIEPGKRMLSAMTPTIVTREGELFLVVGTPGGSTIITTVAQVISNVVDHGMSLERAVAAGRVHHQHLPDAIYAEPFTLSEETVRRLRAMGHEVRERRGTSGRVNAILRRPETGWLEGVADLRAYAGLAQGF